jgi:hypothetical protein
MGAGDKTDRASDRALAKLNSCYVSVLCNYLSPFCSGFTQVTQKKLDLLSGNLMIALTEIDACEATFSGMLPFALYEMAIDIHFQGDGKFAHR